MIAAGGGSLLFVFEGIYPLAGFRRVEKRFYYLTKCGHDFTILAGCGHDFTVLVVGTCDVALFGCILAMVNDIIVCERKWRNNDDGKR